jgi:hypothetical protein
MPNYNAWKRQTVETTKQLQIKNYAYKSVSNIWRMLFVIWANKELLQRKVRSQRPKIIASL